MNPKNNLEYNDGVGDLLKEKEIPPFSWAKTLLIMTGIIVCVLGSVLVAFKAGVALLSSPPSEQTSPHTAQVGSAPLSETPAPAEVPDTSNTETAQAPSEIKNEIKAVPKQSLKTYPVALAKPSKKAPPNSTPKNFPFKVIAGSFDSQSEAKSLQSTLQEKGISTYRWVDSSTQTHRVQVGAFLTESEAKNAIRHLQSKGVQASLLKQ